MFVIIKMAELEKTEPEVDHDEEDNPNYKPPAPKALDDIVQADAEDESLRKYKETLIGAGLQGQRIVGKFNFFVKCVFSLMFFVLKSQLYSIYRIYFVLLLHL